MGTQTSFPVFEADQVLTDQHLNDLRRYLDDQNRLSRSKLIGAGIVCGLEISPGQSGIAVSKGCGLTSQGFLLLFCDTVFTHFIPYSTPDLPGDLDFLSQCSDASRTNIPFYKKGFKEGLLQLLTDDAWNAMDSSVRTGGGALEILSAQSLDEMVVVLFLEAEQVRLKNCDTNDCNDKGSRMDFEPVALLVKKSILDEIRKLQGGGNLNSALLPMALKRYNVPVVNLLTTPAVLGAFAAITDDATIQQLEEVLNAVYNRYSFLLGETGNPFGGISDRLKNLRNDIQAKNPLFIQYFYDFLDDLVKAYAEFREKAKRISGECCPDEMAFPLHLVLGEADVKTAGPSAYRQAFLFSPLLDSQDRRLAELRMLLTRLVLLAERYTPDDPAAFSQKEIRITPSNIGWWPLSDRCIPYYYAAGPVASGPALYQCWNYRKTAAGEAGLNLSYRADEYAAASNRLVREPLLFDLEPYHFFRVEGHIGKQVSTVLAEVLRIKQQANLPVEVIALSADYIGAILRGEDPQCVLQDLESDYRIVVAEFMCKLHDAFCTVYSFGFNPKPLVTLTTAGTASRSARKSAKTVETAASLAADTKDEDDEVTELLSKTDFTGLNINHPVLSRLVSEAQLTKQYVKGSSLLQICGVRKGSIGAVYLSNIADDRFVNPVSLNSNIRAASLYFRFFELIDSIESMFRILLTNELAELDMAVFKTAYARYEKAVNNLSTQLKTITDKVQVFLTTCMVEKLEALKDEYRRRLNQYVLARKFNNYFRQHGGMEHKAGVTKGGTFILVYYEETRGTRFDVSALFVNKTLGALMLARHPDLLQKDLADDDVRMATEELETAVARQCPEQYSFFNNTINEFLSKDSAIPAASREALLAAIRRPPERTNFPFPSGTVIADFYVPYLCCSDCVPVSYVLQPPGPQPLKAIAGPPGCNADGTKYTVTITASGGTPPYAFVLNNTTQPDNNIVLQSGSPDTTVTVTDSAGKTAAVNIPAHNCSKPCLLPCGGASHACHYLLWVAPPDANVQVAHQVKEARLKLTDENGQVTEVDATNLFREVFAQEILAATNFDSLFTTAFAKLNDLVPPRFMDENKRMFSYDSTNKLLVIDKFDCQEVELNLQVTLKMPGTAFIVTASYTKDGTTLTDPRRQLSAKLPPFGCIQQNKCSGEKTELCPENVRITKISGGQETFNQPFFGFKATPAFDAWFWYFHTGVPLFSGDANPQHIQVSATDGKTLVRVIGIKKANGCFALREERVPLDFIIG